MTTLSETLAKRAVYGRFRDQMSSLQPSVTIQLENEAFSEPSPPVPWARCQLRNSDSVQETLGAPTGRQYRRDAQVWVWLYVPTNTGTTVLNGLIDTVRTIFEGVAFGGVEPSGGVRTVPVGAKGQWYEVAVISPVMYYETR